LYVTCGRQFVHTALCDANDLYVSCVIDVVTCSSVPLPPS
jgi:hypothetical protein